MGTRLDCLVSYNLSHTCCQMRHPVLSHFALVDILIYPEYNGRSGTYQRKPQLYRHSSNGQHLCGVLGHTSQTKSQILRLFPRTIPLVSLLVSDILPIGCCSLFPLCTVPTEIKDAQDHHERREERTGTAVRCEDYLSQPHPHSAVPRASSTLVL